MERARYLHAEVYRTLHGVAEPGNCQLARSGTSDVFIGNCGKAFGAASGVDGEVVLKLRRGDAISSGRWKTGDMPAAAWAGDMVISSSNPTEIELQHSIFNDGILRTQFGWFRVHGVERNEDSSRLSFRL